MSARKIDVRIGGNGDRPAVPVGELIFDVSGLRETSVFTYHQSWLEHPNRFAIAPDMPLQEGPTYRTAAGNTSALPLPISDGAPDSWGRAIIKAAFKDGQRGRVPNDLDFLVETSDFLRSGALRYFDGPGPEAKALAEIQFGADGTLQGVPRLYELDDLVAKARAFEEDPEGYSAKRGAVVGGSLVAFAGSLGGARPKVNAQDGAGHLWIAKLAKIDDTYAMARTEVMTLRLAKRVGIEASESKVLSLDAHRFPVALIKRFDRLPSGARIPFISGQTFMGLEGTEPGNYVDVAHRMLQFCAKPQEQMAELHRRLMFTVLVQNADDHLRNLGFIAAPGGGWRLSPAFDVNPVPEPGVTLKTAISDIHGNDLSIEAVIEAAPFFDVSEDEAAQSARSMAAIIHDEWRGIGKSVGMSSSDFRAVTPALDNPQIEKALRLGGGEPGIEINKSRFFDREKEAHMDASYEQKEARIHEAEAEGISRPEEGEHMKHDDFGNHIAADRADKWFDLSQFDARIDRLPVDEMSSGYFLRLELPAEHPAPSVDDLSELGWVKTGQEGGRVTFENAQSASSASAVLEKLGAFFDADDLRTRYKPLRDHVEPPKVFGLKPQRSDIVLSQLVEGVDLADKTRMRNTMALCLGKAATMRQQQENALFAGNGTAMFHHLTSNLVNRSENPWREIEASAYVRSVMEAAGRNPNDQAARMMASLGEALRDRDTASVDELTDGLLRPTETYSADAAETHPDLDNGIRKAIYRNVEFAERAGNQVSATAIAIGQMRGAAYLPAHSMTSDTSITRQNAAEVIEEVRMQLPFDVRLDGSTPTMQAAQSLKAINKALNVAAEALGRAPERILRDNKARFLRLSNENVSPDKGVVGYQAALKTEDDDVIQAITSSARSGRSFIHELGHAVDFSWGFNDAEREACLSRSGVTGAIHDEIDRRFPTEEIEARSYYRDPKEMFARMFDAHVCNVARANGDMDLSSIGGAHTTCGYDIGAPHGNIEATSAFFDEVRATIERKLDAENKAALESTKAASAGVAAPGR